MERNFKFDLINSEKYNPSPVCKARWTKLPDGSIRFNSDVRLLLRQNELSKLLGADTLSSWLGTMDTNYRRSVDTSRLPDNVVLDFVKSRNIQSPSELMAWSGYLNEKASELVERYQAQQAAIKAEQERLAAEAKAKADADAQSSAQAKVEPPKTE